LPQVVQRILILLMRDLPCYLGQSSKIALTEKRTLPVICRNALISITGLRNASIVLDSTGAFHFFAHASAGTAGVNAGRLRKGLRQE
jgi:hypothetical protein